MTAPGVFVGVVNTPRRVRRAMADQRQVLAIAVVVAAASQGDSGVGHARRVRG